MRRRIGVALGMGLGLLLVVLIGLRVRYGGGAPYPDLSGEPKYAASALEIVVTYPEPIGNIAVGPSGRVFFTVHPESRPQGPTLLEWVDGAAKPFPDLKAQQGFQTVLGLAIDRQGRLWTIDHGEHGSGQAQLRAFDLRTGAQVHHHAFTSEVAPLGSFLQDLQVDPSGERVYIADVSFWRKSPGIVIYDVTQGTAWRRLDAHASVVPQDYIIRNPIKDMVFYGGLVALKAGVDGISISTDGAYVSYAAMNHDTLYRVPTALLGDASTSPAQVAGAVEAIGRKPLNDGLTSDVAGNVLLTDVEHSAIVRMTPNGERETLIKDPRIRWADALSYGPDRWVYVADSAIPHQMLESREHIASQAPYFIFRFRADIAGVPGQ